MSSQAEKDEVAEAICSLPLGSFTVVELGAHVGEEYEWLRRFEPDFYMMVEPDPINCAVIRRKYPRANLQQGAISASTGMVMFNSAVNHTSHNRASGSIRFPTGHLVHFPEVEFPVALKIPCWSLDDLCKDLESIDILWCDIQGAERDMIEGGRVTLAKTRYMMIEAEPEVELYEGQALKPELIAMLPDWEIIKDFGYNLFMRNVKYENT